MVFDSGTVLMRWDDTFDTKLLISELFITIVTHINTQKDQTCPLHTIIATHALPLHVS